MIRLVFTSSDSEVMYFDTIDEAMKYGDEVGTPCAITSSDGVIIKLLFGEEWLTIH